MADMTSSTTTTSTLTRSLSAPFESKLSEQLLQRTEQAELSYQTGSSVDKNSTTSPLETPHRTAGKSRSLSDAPKPSPSTQPVSGDLNRHTSKDDSSISLSNPGTPQRISLQPPLSLQLPARASGSASLTGRAPLSPKLDSSHIYGSPASVLPRRSRGLDFSRACTNLHHSTLAESSPDSSPVIAGRGMCIPQRRGSQGSGSVLPFSASGQADRAAISSSVSSVNMMDSDSSSSEDEEDELMVGDRDDMMMITNTPQANKFGGGPMNPFAVGNVPSPGNDWMGGYSQAAASLMSFQRARLGKNRSRHSSSSGSGNSSKPSPVPLSPPVFKSIENSNGGYFGPKGVIQPSRRESLSLGAGDLRLSDFSDDGENRARQSYSPAAAVSNSEGGPLGVIRRAVTRRGSLLPKTKTFARIRAALLEEAAPIDSEARREAEVIRQVRESEPSIPQKSPMLEAFPSLTPSGPSGAELDAENASAKSEVTVPSENNFSHQAIRNSAGAEFWDSFDERYRTPPPPPRHTGPSSISEEDTAMDMTPSTTTDIPKPWERPSSRSSSTPLASYAAQAKKRRREDDFDPNVLKRRAVSPSMSVQSSPVLPLSPVVRDAASNYNIWGPPSKLALGPLFPERQGNNNHNENGGRSTAAHTGTLKRVGLQGMNETNDGFMNMSIE